MKVSDFDYELPDALIAQQPAEPRDSSRLLVLDGATGAISHRHFRDLTEYLRSGDILVANDTRVIPARLFATKPTGGRVEILLLHQLEEDTWQALIGGRNVRPGLTLELLDHAGAPAAVSAVVVGDGPDAMRALRFSEPAESWSETLGYPPLPP